MGLQFYLLFSQFVPIMCREYNLHLINPACMWARHGQVTTWSRSDLWIRIQPLQSSQRYSQDSLKAIFQLSVIVGPYYQNHQFFTQNTPQGSKQHKQQQPKCKAPSQPLPSWQPLPFTYRAHHFVAAVVCAENFICTLNNDI